jgi:hypothetical protein
MEQMTYEQVLASIDRELAARAVARCAIYLGGLTDWGADEFEAVQEQLAHVVKEAGLPHFGDQNDETFKFWGTMSLAAGNDCDYEPPRYVATINTPGYLPMDDDPPVFDTAAEAWAYLAEERERAEDEDESTDEYSGTLTALRELADPRRELVPFTVYGDTPGYDGDHDLGLAYTVSIVEED